MFIIWKCLWWWWWQW